MNQQRTMNQQETHKALIKARALIANEKNWCKLHEQKRVGFFHTRIAYCAVGALKEAGFQSHLEATRPFRDILPLSEGIMGYNDHHSHECVLSAFDAAIERTTSPIPERLPCGAEVALV